MGTKPCLAVIVAAGAGNRMGSRRPKVLQQVGNLPLVRHVVHAALDFADEIVVVVGPQHADVAAAVHASAPHAHIVVQPQPLGTGHAVLQATPQIAAARGAVVVLYGDTPFITQARFKSMLEALETDSDMVALGFHAGGPHAYGRFIVADGMLRAIVEDRDASAEQKAITLCNAGVMGFRAEFLPGLLERMSNDNARGEYYLTDTVAFANDDGLRVRAIEGDEDEFLGIDSKADLTHAQAVFQTRMRRRALDEGALLEAPHTVFFSWDTEIGVDAVIEPYVVFGPGVRVDAGAHIRAFSHLEGAHVACGAIVGPYARLRPGTVLREGAKVGNFVETKNAQMGAGAKANHLSYLGDARIGARANIGAGTITCNYDGVNKHATHIGDNAFVGSNTALVAPVKVGERAYVASGSTITQPIADDALAIARAHQVVKPGRARRLRAAMMAKKRRADRTE